MATGRLGTAGRVTGKTSKAKQYASHKQASQGTLSVKELSKDLEKAKQNEVLLKTKIRALETEVETLRLRLESLRKAKNTTIIKREREKPLIPLSPKLGQRSDTPLNVHLNSTTPAPSPSTPSLSQDVTIERLEERVAELEGKLSSRDGELWDKLRLKEEELRRMHEKETERGNDHKEKEGCLVEELRSEISKLISRNDELTAMVFNSQEVNSRLVTENEVLEEKCSRLEEDLSLKEEQWNKREGQLQAEIRKQWGERYHEWMMKAEKKMEELQKVNAILQTMLKTKVHNPDL